MTPEKSTPGPKELISFDSHIDPLAFLGQLIEQYGDVVRYQTRFGPCILFVNPQDVQTILHRENYRRTSLVKMMLGDGLLASDGPHWKAQRRLMQRDFMPASIAPFTAVMVREADRTSRDWSAAASAGQTVDVTMAMTRLTLRIVVQALFSEDLSEQHSAELCAAVTQTITDLAKISWTVFGVPMQFTPERNATFERSKKVIDSTSYDLIARRRAQTPEARPRDLLTLLIESSGESGPLDDRQVRDEIVTMLVGGHETTALALAWAWKAISEHPKAEERLHAELDMALAGRSPDLADFPRLSWTDAVFQEAMRLYPPVWFMGRVANDDDVIGGHAIPRGACVLISAWFTHRHKDFWTDPQSFDPSRFTAAAVKQRHRYAYFPFSGGRHQCLGMNFGLMEGTIILADLAQRFRVMPINGQQVQPAPGLTLRQSPGLEANIEYRSAQTSRPKSGSEAI